MVSSDFRFYFSIFLRRLPYFLVVATVIGAFSVIVAMTLPPVYVSQMRLIVESPQIPDELAASTALTPAQEQLQIVEQRLMTRANLLDIAKRLEVFEDQKELAPDQILQSMRSHTTVSSSAGRGEAALMAISFEARSGKIAAEVLNEYLTLILKEDVESRTGRATRTLEFFEQEVARLNEALAERSAEILAFKTKHVDALPESLDYRMGQQTLLQERLVKFDQDLASLEDQRARLIQIFEATGQVGGLRGPAPTPEQQQLEDLRAQLNDALALYSESNPKVQLLRARIAQIEEVVRAQPAPEDTLETTGNSLLDVQLSELASRMKALNEQKVTTATQLEEVTDTIERTPTNAIRLDELELDYANIQLQYNNAVARLSKASTGERIEVMSRGQRISVIDPPAAPSRPSKPNRTLIAGGGSLLGILAGIGLVILLELLNRSIRRPEDLVAKLGVTPLATIPYIQTRGESLRRRAYKLLRILVILLGIPAAIYAVHVHYQPLDLIAEQIMDKVGLR